MTRDFLSEHQGRQHDTVNILPNLDRGAIGIDRKHNRTVFIKPCGKDGIYVKWCHIYLDQHHDDGGSRIRTVQGVYETEVFDWLHNTGGILTDTIEWYPAAFNPEPDTYLVDKLSKRRGTE